MPRNNTAVLHQEQCGLFVKREDWAMRRMWQALWEKLYQYETRKMFSRLALLKNEMECSNFRDENISAKDLIRLHRAILRNMQIKIAAVGLIVGGLVYVFERILSLVLK